MSGEDDPVRPAQGDARRHGEERHFVERQRGDGEEIAAQPVAEAQHADHRCSGHRQHDPERPGDERWQPMRGCAPCDAVGADGTAAFALAGKQGYTFNNAATGEFIRAAKGGTHGFFPDFKEIQTGFVAFGYGIKKGIVIPQMGLVDIAPLISKLLKLDMPAGDGVLLEGLLK